MTCRPYVGPNGERGFVCTRGERKKVCGQCHRREATQLCDYSLRGAKEGKTCDAPLCVGCAVKQPGKDTDYCPAHARATKAKESET